MGRRGPSIGAGSTNDVNRSTGVESAPYFSRERRAIRQGTERVSPRTPSPRNNLVALGSAVLVAIYAAGYARTRSAAQLFAEDRRDRRAGGSVPEMTHQPAPQAIVAEPTPVATPAKPA